MRLRSWGLLLLLLGLFTAGAALGGVLEAREGWTEAEAACAGSTDEWCGGGRTLLASLGLAFIPLLGSLGMLLAVAGLVLLLVGTAAPPRRTVK